MDDTNKESEEQENKDESQENATAPESKPEAAPEPEAAAPEPEAAAPEPEAAAPPPPPAPAAPPPVAEPAAESSGAERVGFGARLGAYLIDGVVSGIGGSIIGMVAGASLVGLFFASQAEGEMEGAAAGGLGAMLGGMLGTMAGVMLFYVFILLIEAFTGQTPGKMMLKIKNANADGTAASTGTLLVRALLKYGNFVLTILAGVVGLGILATIGQLWGLVFFIGCFFVIGAKRQAIHDLVAKTAVFKKSDIK